MKVLVIAEWYPSPADPVHGIWAHRQALAAQTAGAEVRVIALRRPVPPLSVARRLARGDRAAAAAWLGGVRAELVPWEVDGLEVTPVPWLGPPRPLSYGTWGWWMAPALGAALSRLRRRFRFDLLHAHNVAPTGHAVSGWARRAGVPLVVSAHGPDVIDVPRRSALGRAAVRRGLVAAALVLANSDWTSRRCLALGAPAGRVRTLHLGADLGGWAPSPGVDPGAPLTLITVAHLQARKGHSTVLAAIAAIDPARRPRYEVIGEGEERSRLEALVRSLGIADVVRFRGQLPHGEALARLAAADVFVMPGVEEPFGVAFIEAMAAGRPAIGSRGEGGPEEIAAAGEGMLLVEPGQAGELAALLRRLDAERGELRRLGAAARATVAAHFTWEACGRATVAAYESVLGR